MLSSLNSLPVGHVRTDPIINQTCLSDHVHTFYGPQRVRPETDYNSLISSTVEANTGNVEENKSLYCHPTVYSYDRSTGIYTRDVMAQTSAYYIWENDVNTRAFPNGFKMIAGLNPDDPDNFPNAIAECVNPSTCEGDCYTENTFFPNTACDELEVSMSFPTCWDGRLATRAPRPPALRASPGGSCGRRTKRRRARCRSTWPPWCRSCRWAPASTT